MATERMQRIIETIRDERRRFEVFCRSLSEEELARPVPDSTWTVRDFIPHLGTLDTELIRWFDAVVNGDSDAATRDAKGRPFDIDQWNEAIVAERREWTLDEILDEAAANRERLIAVLEELTDEQTDSITRFSGDNKRPPADVPLKLFLSGWAHHDAIHVADMLKALPDRADDPEMQAWLDHPAVTWYQQTMAGPARS
ncbi:MAG TPA: DinB family protein [Dehalococcoidia bacterium]